MNNIYRNAEGYYDPTAGAACEKIIKEERAEQKKNVFRPLVYICSPFAGDTDRNIESARKYCRFAVDSNTIPVASHLLYPQFMDDKNPDDRSLGLFFGLVLMDRCEEVWVFSDGDFSEGMKKEYDRAVKRRQKIRFFTTDCKEVQGDTNGTV